MVNHRNVGFTLVELLVSVSLISVVVMYFATSQIQDVKQRIVESFAQDILALANSSMSYFSGSNQWPDQAHDCNGLLDALVDVGAFPDDYSGPDGITISTDCSDQNQIGRVLIISVQFPVADMEQADMLVSFLPTASRSITDDGRHKVVYYVAAPRKALQRYYFYKKTLGSGGRFSVPRPECGGHDAVARYLFIPQSLCLTDAPNGLGGYYFADLSNSQSDLWEFQLRLAAGVNNNSLGDFIELGSDLTCAGEDMKVGVITYCE